MTLDETHDPQRRSWVESANDPASDFPIQNLPFGVFSRKGYEQHRRCGVAIGDRILDVAMARHLLPQNAHHAAEACAVPLLNPLMQMGPAAWTALRRGVSVLLSETTHCESAEMHLIPMADADMHLPVHIPGYTD